MNSSIIIERKRVDCNSLPNKAWQREEVLRKSGLAAGKMDVYYYSPTGKKIESKPQLARQLGDNIDISTFDFQSGNIIKNLSPPSISLYRCGKGGAGSTLNCGSSPTTASVVEASLAGSTNASNSLKRKYKSQHDSDITATSSINCNSSVASTSSLHHQLELSHTLRTDISLVPPIRQTASIFKQPVTVVRNHENSKVKHDTKHGNQEKPKQLFWEKRLERLRACHATGEEFDNIGLPKGIKSVGPNVNEQTVLQSLATALHVLNTPVTGQSYIKHDTSKNSQAFLNPDQPLMQSVIILDEDIRRQEERVSAARRKLQDALKA